MKYSDGRQSLNRPLALGPFCKTKRIVIIKDMALPQRFNVTESSLIGVNNFTEWGLEDNIECYGASDEEMEIYAKISFW